MNNSGTIIMSSIRNNNNDISNMRKINANIKEDGNDDRIDNNTTNTRIRQITRPCSRCFAMIYIEITPVCDRHTCFAMADITITPVNNRHICFALIDIRTIPVHNLYICFAMIEIRTTPVHTRHICFELIDIMIRPISFKRTRNQTPNHPWMASIRKS